MPEPATKVPAKKPGTIAGLPAWAAVLAILLGFLFVWSLLKRSPAAATAAPAQGGGVSPDVLAASAGQPSVATPPSDLLSAEVLGVFGLLGQRLDQLAAAPPTAQDVNQQHQAHGNGGNQNAKPINHCGHCPQPGRECVAGTSCIRGHCRNQPRDSC